MDGGAFSGTQTDTGIERTLFLMEMMKSHLRYDVIGLDVPELLKLDPDVISSFVTEGDSLYVSANLIHADTKELVAPAYRVVQKGSLRIGVTAVSDPRGVQGRLNETPFRTRPASQVLPGVLGELREKADVVVLVANMKLREVRTLARRIPGLADVVLVGGSEEPRGTVFRESGGAVFVADGQRGKGVGLTKMSFTGQEIEHIVGTSETLTRDFREDPETLELVDRFVKNLNAIMREKALSELADTGAHGGHEFVSAETCGACHQTEYERWLETPHAFAFQTLIEIGVDALPECYQCHVTGHGDPAGYHPAKENANSLVGVQCEVCHDKGANHTRDGSYGQGLLMESCVSCHDPANSPDWDAEVYWRMIEH